MAFFNCLTLNAVRALRLLSTDSGTAGSLFGVLQKQKSSQYDYFHSSRIRRRNSHSQSSPFDNS